MKTAKEILYEVTKGMGIVSEECIIKSMELYASQFIHPSMCYNCNGTGVVSNVTCCSCNGAGSLIILPTQTKTNT